MHCTSPVILHRCTYCTCVHEPTCMHCTSVHKVQIYILHGCTMYILLLYKMPMCIHCTGVHETRCRHTQVHISHRYTYHAGAHITQVHIFIHQSARHTPKQLASMQALNPTSHGQFSNPQLIHSYACMHTCQLCMHVTNNS